MLDLVANHAQQYVKRGCRVGTTIVQSLRYSLAIMTRDKRRTLTIHWFWLIESELLMTTRSTFIAIRNWHFVHASTHMLQQRSTSNKSTYRAGWRRDFKRVCIVFLHWPNLCVSSQDTRSLLCSANLYGHQCVRDLAFAVETTIDSNLRNFAIWTAIADTQRSVIWCLRPPREKSPWCCDLVE